MAARYWVGTGTWDNTNTANWSANLNGSPTGASAPTAADAVSLSTAAGNFSMTIATGAACSTLNFNPASGKTITIIQTAASLPAAPTISGGTTGIVSLGSNLSIAGAVNHTGGTINFNGFTFTVASFASNSGTRGLNFSAGGSLIINNTTSTASFSISSATGLTVTGTPTITYAGSVSGQTANITNASTTPFNYTFNSSFIGNITFGTGTGSAIFAKDLIINNPTYPGTINNVTLNISGSVSIPSGTITAGTSVWTFSASTAGNTITIVPIIDNPITFNGSGSWSLGSNLICGSSTTVSTRTITFTAGSLTLGSFNLYCNIFSNTGSGVRSITTSGGSIYVLATSGTVYNGAIISNFTITGNLKVIVATSVATGVGTTRTINNGSSSGGLSSGGNAISVEFLGGSNNTLDLGGFFNDIDLTNFSGPLTNSSHTVFGNYTAPSNTFTAGSAITTFAPPTGTTKTITATNAMNKPVTFSGLGTSQVNSDLNLSTTRTMVISSGTVDFQLSTIRTVTCSTVTTSIGSLLTGNADINASGTGSIITLNGLVASTIGVYSVNTSGTARTITVNSPSYSDSYGPILSVSSGSGTVTLTGALFLVNQFSTGGGFTGTISIASDIYFNGYSFDINSSTSAITGSGSIYCKRLVSTGVRPSIGFRLKTLPGSLILDNPDGLIISGSFDTLGIAGSLNILNGTLSINPQIRLTVSGGITSSGSNTRGIGPVDTSAGAASLTTPSLTVSGSGNFSFSYGQVSIPTISVTGSVNATLDFLYGIVGGTTTSTTVTINTTGTINWDNQLTITGSSSRFTCNPTGSVLPSIVNISPTSASTFTLTNEVTLNTVNIFYTTLTTFNLSGIGTITSLVVDFASFTQTAKFILQSNHTFTNCTIPDRNQARRIFIQSNINGTRRTFATTNPISGNFIDFKDIALTPTNNITGTSLGDVGNNTGITFPAAKTVYWAKGSGNAVDSNAWSLSVSGTSPSLLNFPLAQDTMVIPSIIENPSVTGTITFSNEVNLGTILSRNRTTSITLQFSRNCNVVGNLDLKNTSFVSTGIIITFLYSTSINSTTGDDLNVGTNSLVFNNNADSTYSTIISDGVTTASGYTYTFKGIDNGTAFYGNPYIMGGNITVYNNFFLSTATPTTTILASSSMIVNGYFNTTGLLLVNDNCTFNVGLNLSVSGNLTINTGCSVSIGSFISVLSDFTLSSSLTVNAPLTVGGAMSLGAAALTFTTNTSNVSFYSFNTVFSASNLKTINMNSCDWYVNLSWFVSSDVILNCGTSRIFLGPADVFINFTGGGKIYNEVIVYNQQNNNQYNLNIRDPGNIFNILRKYDCSYRTDLTFFDSGLSFSVYNMIFDNTNIFNIDTSGAGLNCNIVNLSNSALFFTNCTIGDFIVGIGTIKAPSNRGNNFGITLNIDFSSYTPKTTQILSFFE